MSIPTEQLSLLTRLELIERNPLTRSLQRYDDDLDLAKALRRNPFAGGAPGVCYSRRLQLVDEVVSLVSVTPTMLAGARGLHNALFSSLDRQNPLNPNNRRRVFAFFESVGKPLKDLPWAPEFGGGLVFAGWTGNGKSRTVERFLELVPQVVIHEANPEYGWTTLRQLVWLKVHMPSDGSRGGLLVEMLKQIDKVLETDYAKQYLGKGWTVEKLLVVVIYILLVHRCGLVVIEECQDRNLAATSRFGTEFVQFFLRLLNAGMGVAVLGNPLAFDELTGSAQTEARLTEYGWFDFMPITDVSSEEWSVDVVNGVWKAAQLLDDRDDEVEGIAQLIFDKTGGVLRYVARLRRVTLALGLRTGARRVTKDLILSAAESPEMHGVQRQIGVFAERDLAALANWGDLPTAWIQRAWLAGDSVPEDAGAGGQPSAQPKSTASPLSESTKKPSPSRSKKAREGRNKGTPTGGVAGYLGDDFRAKLLAELENHAALAGR
ncbi:hypothetical protein [Aquincola tertiaricarbonis]|uniref:hypothetical protein n=1 Tax=Aquincola tertiaricarbonis TaxID=391953 RepID=UPI000615095D|nr:hypothetical protein [Aquincola tertiaricarbonis]